MMIKDLSLTKALDSNAMSGVRGGFGILYRSLPDTIQAEKEKVDDDQSQVQFLIR
jgi:hypothetical protein